MNEERKVMLVQKYRDMLSQKSVIRQLAEWAGNRGKEIGYKNVFDYSLGNPSVPVPEDFTDGLMDMLKNMDSNALHGYSPTLGIPSVRAAVAASLKERFGLPYGAEHIFMTSGAAGALAHAIRLVAQEGDEIITFAPFFPEYYHYVEAAGPKLIVVPPDLEAFQINFPVFESLINEKTAAILMNSPNNPSGAVYSGETMEKLATVLKKKSQEYGHEIFLISDEPYREIVFDGMKLPCACAYYENSIMCYSFSKSLSVPGGRIGYLAVHPGRPDGEMMVNMCGQISRGIGHNCPTSLMQLGVAKVLNETADLSVYETNRNLLYKELTELGFSLVKPGGTFYMFPKALEEDANAFSKKALKYDLVLVPGDSFGAPGYFRISYCVETEKVERSLAAFRRFVDREYPNR
jgi:aspartate aminotransferase